MCDCFHLVLPNWPGSPASVSGTQLRPEDTEADGEADAEDDSISEVTTESIRPRPQGSSPVYEYCIEDEYFNKKLQQDIENRQRRESTFKMSDSQESMEVTLQTEVESGASGFSVAGGGAEGLFVKQVLKESSASKLFSLREGDQLLSATIFFDNIKYEDALKILQYSEPYKVQFSLKRKLVGKDELETIHSATQSKKEKLSQGMDTMEISEKTISEEDKANLIVKQRVGRQKRTKKDRLSWPKFQSIKGKKILGHRRSRSTSDAYEHGIPDVSPTSTDTESQFQPEEIHWKMKKQSQKKLKFPTIGFKMHKSKQEPYEINPFKEYENDTTMELSEVMTREYTSLNVDRKSKEKEPKRGVSDTVFPIPQNTQKYPAIEVTITKPKEKKLKPSIEFTKQEPTVVKTQMKTAVIHTKDITDSQIKVSQNIPKIREKKLKDSKVQLETQYPKEEKGKETNIASKYVLPQTEGPKVEVDIKMPKMDFSLPKADHKATKPELKMGEITADINISLSDVKSIAGQGILELKTPDRVRNILAEEIPVESSAITLEDEETKFNMLKLQMPKFGVSLPKGKGVPEEEQSISSIEADLPKTFAEIEANLTEVDIQGPSLDMEIRDKGKIKMPALKMPSVKVAKLKPPEVGIAVPRIEADVTLPKQKVEGSDAAAVVQLPEPKGTIDERGLKIHMPSVKVPKVKGPEIGISLPKVEADVTFPKVKAEVSDGAEAIKLPEAEGTIEGGGLKIHMPKFKMPSMGFSKPDIKGPKVDVDVSMPKVDLSLPEAELHVEKPEVKGADITISAPEIKIPTDSVSLELKATDIAIEPASGEVSVEGPDVKLKSGDRKFQMPKFHMPKFGISLPKGKGVPEGEIGIPSMEADLPKTELKTKITLPSAQLEAELKLPEVEVDAPSLDMEIGDKGKIKMPEAKIPSIKVPKVKGPEVGISLPKVEADVTIPKVKAEVSDGAEAVKLPETEGTMDRGGLKRHMPKFKMPSMGFSKPDIKGPKVDVDVSMPKVDISLPEAEIRVEKPEVKGGDITISTPEVKIPAGSASLELKAPDIAVEPASGKVSMQGPDVKLESGDMKFQMPKFHMPKFGISPPKGTGIPEAEISIPSVEADLPKTELKTEITLPSAQLEADLKLPEVEVGAPSLDVEIGDKGKIKMPEAKIPSIKVPKVKGPEVGVSLPKVEADVTVPKVKAEVSDGAEAVKLPEAEGTIDRGGLKIHMPKFKMPSMGFSKPDIKGPKVDVDVSMPKVDLSLPEAELHVEKPEVKGADITISAPEIKIPTDSVSLELKATDIAIEPASGEVSVEGPDVKLKSGDRKFQMPKFHMPKFGISLPKGKGVPEGEIGIPSMEADLPKTELKTKITLPSAQLEAELKLPEVEVDAPSLDMEIGDKGKIKMPEAKIPSIKVPKVKGPEVGISLPKVEADVTIPKVKAEVSDGAEAVKLPETEGTMDRGGLKRHMPKFKMPSMGFSKPDIKGPKVDVDVSMPKVDISLPEAEIRVEKPEVKGGDITISTPEVKIPAGSASLELKAPDIAVEPASGKVSMQGPDVKLESGDMKFQMPKFHMPKFGISPPKGTGIPEAEISIPSVEADLPKTELKTEITLPSAQLEADLKLPEVEVGAPSLDVEIGDKGKIKMPEAKIPSIKVPKVKGPEVGVSLPKVEADVTVPKVKAEVSDGAEAVKLPEAEGTIDRGGLKIHMPKFKMPSMGFSKPDIKGHKVDVDVSMPKVDISLPEAELHVEKPEVKGGDITISAPKVKIPTGSASLELKAPDVAIEPASGKVSVQGPNVKLESGDMKFHMPKFHMPKFGISLPKGTGIPEAEIGIPSMDADLPKTELKTDIILPSAQLEADLKLPEMEVDAPSLDVEIGDKGKIKIPEAKMPRVKVPKVKGPEVGISLPKIEADVTVPKVKAEVSDGAEAVKLPETEGTMDRGGLKIHMPKFKMPSMGFSKPDIKGPKVDVDVSMPKVDLSLPETEIRIEKPEVKGGDITISTPEVKIPAGSASLELKAPDIAVEPASGQVSMQGPDVKLESGDMKFQMPKFHMPKFGISLPKGTGIPEAEIGIPSMDADLPKAELKTEITLPSAQLEADLKLPEVEVDAPSLDVKIGKAKMPSVKVPKVKGPEVGISLPKVEADVTIPKVKAEVSDGAEAVKLPETEGTMDRGGLKIHMPKFKMPSMGFSKSDIKGPKVDVDVSMPKVDLSLPEAELHVKKPEVKGRDITISAPEVKIPTGSASLELKAPDIAVEPPSGKVSMQGPDVKLESGDRKFQMPKFHMPKFGISLPKGTDIPEAEIGTPSVEADLPKTELKTEITLASAQLEADLKLPEVEVDAPSLDVKIGKAKMPSVKVPKVKGPEVGVSLPKVEADVTVPKVKAEVSDGAEAVKLPEAEGTMDRGGLKRHMPKFKMPSMGFSKPDIKGHKVDVDVSMPKMDISLPEAEIRIEKPDVKGGDITISAPEVKIPTDSDSLELKTPDVAIEPPSGKVSMQGSDVKLESGDRKFQMPKFHMPKFGISLPKGKDVPEAETDVPSMEADLPKTEMKTEITLPSAQLEAELKLSEVEVDAPSLDMEIGDKGKIKMPEAKMPSVKVSKVKGPEVGISLPKIEADVTVPKVKAEVSDGAEAVKLPETEGTMDRGGLKRHMPKFKMPSMGFSKPDIKGPKVDVDVIMPKVDLSLPEAEIRIEKPEVKGEDITISAPEVKIPTDSGSLELKAPNVAIEPPSGKVSVQGPDVKLESGDVKFQMLKFHMPKFGISLPKGTGIPEAEIGIPSMEADLPKTELKTEITLPSAQFEADLKLSQVEIDAPSLDVQIGHKGKMKIPKGKMPSVKIPKVKGPEVGISLPKVEADVTVPKVKAEVSDGAEAVKLPEAEGTIDGGGLKTHMPKCKMPSTGFSKPDIKGPKVDVDVSMPKVDLSLPEAELHVEKPEVKGGDITISAPELKIPTDSDSLELKTPNIAVEPTSGKVSMQGPDVKLESGDMKFQMPKFHMPKFGTSLPKGKGVPEGEIVILSVETDLPKTELKTEITLPSAQLEAELKLAEVEVDAPSLDMEIGDKGKIKMPEAKMPRVKVPKVKGADVGISPPKVEADVTVPKVKAEVSDGAEAVKLPEAEGTIDRGGLKIHMPKFKMPSMGFSKPDIKGPKVDVDVSMPKVDLSLPEAELHVEKPEVKGGDITISAPELKIPTDSDSLELKTPDIAIEPPSGKVSMQGPDVKLESADRKFHMPTFHMPKFGISLPKGKGVSEAETDIPSVEADLPKKELKMEITLTSAQFEADLKLPEVEADAPSLEVAIGDKGKIKTPKAKTPSIKVPKVKGPEVGISLPKVEADVALPKVKAEVSDGAEAIKLPEAEGTIEGGGLKIHMPKFKMPSMGFSKPDIKGPKVDVDVSMPKVDLSLPEAELHVEKPEVKGGDITILASEVKIPTGSANLELKAPDIAVEPASAKVSVQGPDVRLESGDMKFQMPKFHMPKFGISLPKGTGIPEAEISIPSVEADLPKAELKTEKTLPSAQLEADLKLPEVEVDAPSLDVKIGKAKLPSVKVPKVKGPDVGISPPKVEADVTIPKVKAEVSDGAEAVKLPEAEGTIDRGGLKIHMSKFKMPSRGLSKPDIKGPKVDVDVSMPKVDISLPEAEIRVEKPEVKGRDITISASEVKIPTDSGSLDLKAPDVAIEPPSGKFSVQGPDVKLRSGDRKFQMPKFHMPKFGISLPKGKGVPEAEISIASVEADLPKTEVETEITLPSAQLEADLKLPKAEVDAPSLDWEIGDKGKIKIPEAKMPSVKVPKVKGPEVGISLPKVEADVALPKVKAEMSDGAEVKLPEAEDTIDGGGLKIHMPKFKMPSMGFSKPDIKGHKVDVDVSMPKVDHSLPEAELYVEKPEVKGDITISAPEVKIPTDSDSLDLKAPNVAIEPPSGKVSVQGPNVKLESGDRKFQMPKFHMPKFGISLPKGKGVPEAETDVPSVEAHLPKKELKMERTLPSAQFEADLKLPEMEVDAPSLDVEIGDKGKIKMPEAKIPSVKVPKVKGPEVEISLPKVEADVVLPIVKAEVSDGAEAIKLPEAEGTMDRGGLKRHMPKFKIPSMGFSKPDIKGPKVDVDVNMPKVDLSLPEAELHVEKPEVKGGDITISSPEVKIPMGSASLELKAPDIAVEPPSGKVSAQGPDVKLESGDRKFQMPKFHMPKFGISLPKGTSVQEAEIAVASVETDLPKTEFKTEITLPSAQLEADLKLPEVEVDTPSLDVEIGDKGKIKIPKAKMPSVKVPKVKGPEVAISLPKVEADVTIPKVKAEVSDGTEAIKLPEAEGTMDRGGLKIHMPKFKMPSIGFSKPDIKGPNVDVDVSMPKVDLSLSEAELHIKKPEVKGGDITISAPEVKIPTDSGSLDLKAPDVAVETPSGKVSVQGHDVKLESGDRKFQMPRFHMPKFGISLPKGTGVPEAEIGIASVETDLPKTELKTEITLPSAQLEADLKLPEVEVDTPSLDVEIGDKGKIKIPKAKKPSVKVPKVKGPEVGISLPKVEADVAIPKVKAEVFDGAEAVKLPEAEGTIEGGGLKIHMPKFKMPSIGFSKPDIKGPNVDVDIIMPKVDLSLPEAELHVEKPEVKGGDITISAPEVKIPTVSASLELKAHDIAVEPPSGKVSVQGPDVKMESRDRKFQMPKFHMPKFGISMPKGKGVPEGEISIPSVEAELPKTELKTETTLPSVEFEADLKLPKVEVDTPSLEVDIVEGKMKLPDVKMPSVKVPKVKGPEVGISLPKVEADVTIPKVKTEVSDGAEAVKLPEAEDTIDRGGLKIHMPKFKMPSKGLSKPDIKGPKVDVDVSMTKVDVTLPEPELQVQKPEVKEGDITISEPEIKFPTGSASLELKAADIAIEPPSGKVSVQGPDVKLESGDNKFKVPKFQMPKFGISKPKGKDVPEGEVIIPSMEGDLRKTNLQMEITLPSSELEADMEAPILHVDVEEKGKIKMPGVTLPSVKPPKLTAPEVDISLPKVEVDVSLSKVNAELPDSEATSKVVEAEGGREKGRMKIHMPKFKMPSMGFSKSDIKGPKIDADASMPDVHTSLPKVELSITKPQLKTAELEGDIGIAAHEVKIPWVPVTVELQAPNIEVQASSGKVPDIAIGLSKDLDVPRVKTTTDIIGVAVEAPTIEMESDVLGEKKNVLEQKIKMPQIIRADVKTAAVGISTTDISVTQSEVGVRDLHGAGKEPETKGEITKEGSLDGEEKAHFKMPKFKLPSLSWSPKKEASLKTNIKEPLEEPKLDIVSDDTGTEPKVTLSEDQGVHTDGNVDIATKKGQIKRPHLIMPKISLSKTKLPKADVDIVVEGDGALVQIPDIESSFTTRKVEETEISVKMLKGEIKEETKTFQTDTDINLFKTDIKVPMAKGSFEQKCLETEFKGDICMDSASMKSDGTEGEFRMPKLKMPRFGISDLSESDLSGSGISSPKPESDVSQFQITEYDKLGGKAQSLQVKSDEGISEEIQIEESQSWFKMPKFKMPSFGRTSKTKKSDAETEDITGEAHVTELQVEVKSPIVVTISREPDSEKNISKEKVMLPQEDVIVQKEKQSTTDQLVGEGSFLHSSEKIGRKPSDLESKMYANVVKDGAEGQSSQTEFIGTVPKMDIDRNIPRSEMPIQQPEIMATIAVTEIPSTEITMGRKIDAIITDTEPLQSLDTQPEEMGTEKKSPKKDSQGKESIFKMPTFSVPLFGWSTTKSNAIVPGIESDLEEPVVTLSKVKMDVSITDEDFEIIDFPVEGFEKDLPKEGEVKAEEKEKTSKTKASKFKIPKFANLRSKSQGAEIQVDSPKEQTEVSLVRSEEEIQVQDKKTGDAEVSFQMPKFKMPKFTHRISEGEKLISEETMEIKDTTDDDISQLQFKTMFPEDKGDDIQKSKVRITTLSEPAIQRPQVGSKFPSTDSSFADTTVYLYKQVPKEFSAEFFTEKIDTIDGNIQKSITKITTLKEPDIQRAPLEIKLQPEDPFSSSASVQVKGSITDSKEIKIESKSTFGSGDDAEIQETFSTQIVKESEIPPSEVKTAAFGFSLRKVKIQESHVSLDVPIKLSSTKCMGEIFEDKDHQLSGTGEAAQKAGLSEVKPSDKDKDVTYEFTEGTSATLTKLKSFTVDIQSSSEFAESHSESIEISKSATETAEETIFTSSTDEVTDEKEKLDSKRSGKFKLWFPSIGFSSTTDDSTSDSKPEALQKVQPDDSSKLDSDTAKETDKTEWFKFPKLGLSSPTKKSKEMDQEKETDSEEEKDEESLTEKNETFFDAQETLSLTEKEENETSGDTSSEPIVSSSARTELILLEKGKAKPKYTPEDSSK